MLLLIILVTQLTLVSWTFPLSELLTDKPLFYSDAAFHWYQMKLASNLSNTGVLAGYDPFFNAGYPGGVTYNWSAKLPAALSALFPPGISEIKIYKMVAFVSAVLAPACVPLAARWLGAATAAAVIASLFGMVLWWASYFHWYHTSGMVSFVMASYLALPYCALAFRFLRREEKYSALILLGLVGALATFYHPLFPLPVAIAILTYAAFFWRNIPRNRLLAFLILVPILSLLPNLVWLYPMYHFHNLFSAGIENVTPYQRIVDVNFIWKEMLGIFQAHYHGAKIYATLVLASAWACVRVTDDSTRRIAWVLTVSAGLIIVFAAVGGAIPGMGQLQPNRFAPVGYLLLVIPGGLGVIDMLTSAQRARHTWQARAAIFSLVIVAAISTYSLNEVRREVSYAPIGHYGKQPPEVDGIGDYSRWVLDWLAQNTTPAGRVLFETSNGRIYDGARMAGYYAYTSDREFIGGPYPYMHFAGFWDGWLFGKPIQNIGEAQFAQYLDLYNIGWIIAHHETTKRYLDNIPWVKPDAKYRQLQAYKIERQLSFFLVGQGRIQGRGHNRLVVSDITGDEVVLKYHFVPGMASTPPTDLTPVRMMDDPNPFIRIAHPPRNVTLYLPSVLDTPSIGTATGSR